MKWYYISAICWVFCIAGIYVARYIISQKSFNKLVSAMIPEEKTKLKSHLLIIFLAPIVALFGIIILSGKLIRRTRKKRFENRPRPLKGKMKKYKKRDRVIDEDNNVVPLSQYNLEHGTNFTLEDVYGNGYEAGLSEEELAAIKAEQNQKLLEIHEGLPDTPHKQAAITLAEALLHDDYTEFETVLDDASELVIYDKQSFKGNNEIISYWKDRMRRIAKDPEKENYVVAHCAYCSTAALKLCARNYATLLVIFRMEEGRIKKMVLTPESLNDRSLGCDENLNKLPMKVSTVKRNLATKAVVEPKQNHLFCPHCGAPSESLDWCRVDFSKGMHGHLGDVSICPNCNRVVEYRADIRYRLEKPRPDSMEDNVGITRSEINTDEPQNELARIWNDFHNCMDYLQRQETEDIEIVVLKTLSSLSIAPGFKLRVRWASVKTDSLGDNSRFYTYVEGTEGEDRDLDGIRVENNEKAIWQYYLLDHATAILPAYWHGGYFSREFIMSMNDCVKIEPLKERDLRDLAETGLIQPSVVIEKDNQDGLVASVFCSYWNNWEGLVREQMRYTIKDNMVESTQMVGKTILFKYNCGIVY